MTLDQQLIDLCVAVVQQTAEFQMKYFRAMPAEATDIKAVRETVSFVDVESEKILLEGLAPLVEGAGFYGEETGKTGSQDVVWIVDPLDGTTNYLSGLDHFSISVALVKHGTPVLGLVCRPATGDIYVGVQGLGCFYNGKPTQPAYPDMAEDDALFMTGFPYRSHDVVEQFFSAAPEVLKLGRGIRRSGSAALDVANLAMGWIQGFWETDLQPYDIAAGLVMMAENGIVVTNQHGQPFDMFNDRLMVAGLKNVHPELLKVVSENYSI